MPPPPDNTPAAAVEQHAARNALIVALAAQQVSGLWPRIDWPSPKAVVAVTALYSAIVIKFGTMAAAAAAVNYDTTRAALNLPTRYRAIVAPPVTGEQIGKIVTSAFLGTTEPGSTTSNLPLDQRVPGRLDLALSRLVLQPARDTIAINTTKDPAKPTYIRVPTGDKTCTFCMMLASRELGPNFAGYASKTNALFNTHGERYHTTCDCEAVPVFPGQNAHDVSPNMADYQDIYHRAAAAADSHSDVNAIQREMRKIVNPASTNRARQAAKPQPTKATAETKAQVAQRLLPPLGEKPRPPPRTRVDGVGTTSAVPPGPDRPTPQKPVSPWRHMML